MEIESIQHKALRELIEKGSVKAVIEAGRVVDMIAFLVSASGLEEVAIPPNFGFHPLTGDRKGTYAMTVTKNWRLTFTLADDATIADLDLEDYH
ncbi:type II toxin-antitoxin system RelE/ParE family toxin [Sphingobium baderi]|uniref:Plasmid maintenance system killer n=1 Tax=Sphingobium baderi TaxID=1332080 RepID=A0A0S3EZY1_9SPHN|nr:type II toxin-antitoxin system RelE/ParE family toxin [Sphingobium baderi]ALR20950.1 plasmid maintenance system killer [Sphingobium baderi]